MRSRRARDLPGTPQSSRGDDIRLGGEEDDGRGQVDPRQKPDHEGERPVDVRGALQRVRHVVGKPASLKANLVTHRRPGRRRRGGSEVETSDTVSRRNASQNRAARSCAASEQPRVAVEDEAPCRARLPSSRRPSAPQSRASPRRVSPAAPGREAVRTRARAARRQGRPRSGSWRSRPRGRPTCPSTTRRRCRSRERDRFPSEIAVRAPARSPGTGRGRSRRSDAGARAGHRAHSRAR